MEYLVTMTTHVPAGTPEQAVETMRARESAHTRELAAQGHVLRLWRPPLAPGEWRTLGLFAAADGAELERVLTSMPLRAWRTDEVQQLARHPNDPAAGTGPAAAPAGEQASRAEFLVTFTPAVPDGTGQADLAEATAREADRAADLAREGHLVRLWALPAAHGTRQALGLWRAATGAQLTAILESLPLRRYQATQATPLTAHPSDPAAPGSRPQRTGGGHG